MGGVGLACYEFFRMCMKITMSHIVVDNYLHVVLRL